MAGILCAFGFLWLVKGGEGGVRDGSKGHHVTASPTAGRDAIAVVYGPVALGEDEDAEQEEIDSELELAPSRREQRGYSYT